MEIVWEFLVPRLDLSVDAVRDFVVTFLLMLIGFCLGLVWHYTQLLKGWRMLEESPEEYYSEEEIQRAFGFLRD